MRRLLVLAGLVVGCGSSSKGGEGGQDASVASTSLVAPVGFVEGVRAQFQRDGFGLVVPGEGTLTRTERAFVPSFAREKHVEVTLPLRANAPFELSKNDMRLRVTMLGASGSQGTVDGDAVVYAGALPNTTLFHVPTVHGTEEYLRVDSRPESAVVRYHLDFERVAGLRLVEGVLELLDASGNPVLHTAAPFIVDSNGVMRRGALALEDCKVDASPAPPWGRAVVAPATKGCTLRTTWNDEGLAYPVLVDPPWTTAGTLAVKRSQHTASKITGASISACTGGCVLVAGGQTGQTSTAVILSSAELYNASTNSWATTGSMSTIRRMHSQVDYLSGRALVAGGATDTSGATPLSSAEIYNSTTGTWAGTGAMPAARWAGAMILNNSYAYFSGGFNSGALAQNTLYAFNGTTWSTSAAMTNARARHQVQPFVTGNTIACDGWLVAGGIGVGGSAISTVEYYGTQAGSGCAGTGWNSVTGTMSSVRTSFASADHLGRVYFFGGSDSLVVGEPAEIVDVVTYNISTSKVTVSPLKNGSTNVTLPAKRTGLAAASVTNGSKSRVVIMGGAYNGGLPGGATSETDLLDSTAATVVAGSNLAYARRSHTATTIGTKVLVVGGVACNSSSGCHPANEELWSFGNAGDACKVTDECLSGFCVDGVCCNSACTGQCQGCNETGSVGTCKTVSGTPRGTRAACPSPNTGACGYQCNGVNATACVAAGSTTECTAATCTSGVATPASKCDGSGNCIAQANVSCGKFACNPAGTACLTPPCASNADCASGYKCDSGSKDCVPTGGVGSPCAIGTDCSSGLSCVDSVCCTASSCTGGKKCNVPGAVGSCKLPYGTACSSSTASDCATGNCVDGVCCDTACNGQCEQCNLTSYVGTCKPVPAGGKPVGARTACTGTGACQASCDGTSRVTCGAPSPTSTVCAAASCSAGSSTPARYCDGLGACTPASSSPCGAYKCDTAACKTTCATNADCISGYFCNSSNQCVTTGADGTFCGDDSACTSGHCVDNVCCKTASCASGLRCDATSTGTCAKPIAAGCSSDAECGSGFCTDGVCCNVRCDGQCEACNVTGVVGTCSPVAGDPRGSRTACTGTGACKAKCDGAERTKCGAPPGTSTPCLAESCTGTAYTATSYCNGLGACTTPPVASCGAYKCDSAKCKSSCISSTDCATGYGCKSGVCVTTGALGTVCTDPTQCTSGKCIGGPGGKTVCCSVDTCPDGSICADETAGDRAGTCVKPRGKACTNKDECSSGFCVDGVCCDSLCDGQCEACAVTGAEGTCTGITGAPKGSRAPCFDGGGDVCKALQCNPSKDRTKCTSFKNGIETECGSSSCSDRTETAASRCDGDGNCQAGTTKSCGAYQCDAKTCKVSCAAHTDCAPGFSCQSGKCEAIKARCDGTQSVSLDGSTPPRQCAPFRCDDATGTCVDTCNTTTDCVNGALCDGGRCVAPSGETDDGGGCAMSTRGATSTSFGFALVALALGLATRRRSRL